MLLKRLRRIDLFVSGSMVVVSRRCGNPRCRCAVGDKHKGYYLMYKVKAKTQAVYVPVDLVPEVMRWVREHRRIKRLMAEISDLQKEVIRLYVRTKRRAITRR
ncbi:MAG: hypothetical protein NTZ78_07255 [Candidatus Aureabacteria bacterium]|nr:hypothetical protein [Candidatus Auribacterota bacterium]